MSINPKYSNFISILEKNNYNQNLNTNEKCICNTSSSSESESESGSSLKPESKHNLNKNNKNTKNDKTNIKKSYIVDETKTLVQRNNKIIKSKNKNFEAKSKSDSLISTDVEINVNNKSGDNSSDSVSSVSISKKSEKSIKSVKTLKKLEELSQNMKITEKSSLNKANIKIESASEDSGILPDKNIDSDSSNEKIWIENKKDHDSVDSEFKELFREKIRTKPELNSKEKQMKKLNKLFEKTVETINTKTKNKEKEKKKEIQKMTSDELVKFLSSELESNIFLNSTKGFNVKEDIYKVRFDKLKTNLIKFTLPDDKLCEIGYLYRNFNNPKVYSSTNINSHWLETTKKYNGTIVETELEPDNRFLTACMKNFLQSNKFKKKIGSYLFRAFKKTIQIYETNLIVDIIFFVKYKI